MYSPDGVIHNANRVTKIDLKKFPWFFVGLLWELTREWSKYYRELIPREMQGLLYLGINVSCWITSANQMQGKQLSFVRYSLASFYIIRHF